MAGASILLRARGGFQSKHLVSTSSSSSGHPWSSKWRKKMRAAASLKTLATSTDKRCSSRGGICILRNFHSSLAAQAARALAGLPVLSPMPFNGKSWTSQTEILIEQGIIGCQSFTLIAVAGTLIGSILSFVEGCYLVVESFIEYFGSLSTNADRASIIQLLIEAIDMFLLGSSLLTFGMGLYSMFAPRPDLLKRLRVSMEVQSIPQAKSKFGHAVALILQAGILDKFKNVPVSNGLDLACFAGAVLISSACVFLLSKLAMRRGDATCI